VLDFGEAQRFPERKDVHAEAAPVTLAQSFQPPTGLPSDLAQASTVPSTAGFASSALPSGIQLPCFLSIVRRSSSARS
jgi:hypothetical protein